MTDRAEHPAPRAKGLEETGGEGAGVTRDQGESGSRGNGEGTHESGDEEVRATEGPKSGWLLVGGLVFATDGDNNDTSCRVVDLVEYAVIPPCPDTELILPAGYLVVPPRPGVFLQLQNHPGHAQERLVIQLEQLALG